MFLKRRPSRLSFHVLVCALGVLVHWESTRSLLIVVRVSSFSVFTFNNKPMFFPSPSLSAHPFGSSVKDFLLPLLLFSDSSSSVLLSPQTRRHRHLPPSPPFPPSPLPLHPPSLPLRLPRTLPRMTLPRTTLPRTTLPRTTLPQTLSTSSTSSQGTPSSSKATTSRP